MGVFDDQKFEQLDWMTQVTETIDSELNTALAKLPDEIEVNLSAIRAQIDNSYNLSLSLGNLLDPLYKSSNIDLGWEDEERIESCFEFQCSDILEVDLVNNTMTGSLKVVKIKPNLEDSELQGMMGGKGISVFTNTRYDDSMVSRSNEILDLLDASKEDLKTRSIRKKRQSIARRLRAIFASNEWRIRDMELADKVSAWCREYILSGNLAAMTNLCKLKVMTHSNMPIYSIKEEQ